MKATVTWLADKVNEWDGPHGKIYFVNMAFADGSSGSVGAKSAEKAAENHALLETCVGTETDGWEFEAKGDGKVKVKAFPGRPSFSPGGKADTTRCEQLLEAILEELKKSGGGDRLYPLADPSPDYPSGGVGAGDRKTSAPSGQTSGGEPKAVSDPPSAATPHHHDAVAADGRAGLEPATIAEPQSPPDFNSILAQLPPTWSMTQRARALRGWLIEHGLETVPIDGTAWEELGAWIGAQT